MSGFVSHYVPCDMCGIAGGTWFQFAPDGNPAGCVERHDRNECAWRLREALLRERAERAAEAAKE
jgi:hypothetical protein